MRSAWRLTPMAVLCLLLTWGAPPKANGQEAARFHPDSERGIPSITNYNTSRIGFDANNFDVIRDARGVLFIANVDGLIEWIDEETLTLHSTMPDRPSLGSPIFDLGRLADGTLVYAAYKSFGRVTTTDQGSLRLEALSDSLPERQRPTGWVGQLATTGNVAWFKGDSMLYRWDGTTVRGFAAPGRIRFLGQHDGRLYLHVEEQGMFGFDGKRFVPIPGLEGLDRPNDPIRILLPAGDGRILLFATKSGWLWLEDGRLQPAWSPQIRAALPAEPICGIVLRDGSYAIGTSRNGIFIVERNGRVGMVLDESTGLRDEAVQGLYQDDEHILWAALDDGFARIDWPSAMTMFDRSVGLKGRVTGIVRFQGRLYVNTTLGTYRLVPADPNASEPMDRHARFELIEDAPPEALGMIDCGDDLLLASAEGVFVYDGRNIRRLIPDASREFFALNARRDSVLVTLSAGVTLLSRVGRSWSATHFLPELDGVMVLGIERSIVDGSIWFSSWESGLFHVRIDSQARAPIVTRVPLTRTEKQPQAALFPSGRRLVVITNTDTTYSIDLASGAVRMDTMLYQEIGFPRANRLASVTRISDRKRLLQLIGQEQWWRERWYGIGSTDGAFEIVPDLFRQIMHSAYSDTDGIFWFGSEEYLFRRDLELPAYTPLPSRMLIRWVYDADTVWYRGNLPSEETEIVVPYSLPGVTVLFAANQMKYPEQLRYRWKLIGESDDWSQWSRDNTAAFPGLMEGTYTFVVEGRGAFGDSITQATIRIRVAPPMHRTWWAYALYVLGASGLFVLALRFRTRRLEQRGRELEATIEDRTVEIRQQSEKIQSQAEELETLDAIVRTVNKEVRLTDVLSALLQQTLLLFPYVSTAFYLQRSGDDGLFRLVATVGEPAESISSRAFTLSEIMDDPSNTLQTIQDGVYVLRGLEKVWSSSGAGSPSVMNSFMGMSDVQQATVRGFLVLGSDRMHQFDANDLRKLLRLREHVSSAVAKALAIRELESKNDLLDKSNRQLRDMQQQLIVHEKLAALGELTAGIAHEIQNPLNFVNNFSSLSLELLDELEEDMIALAREDSAPLIGLVSTVRSNCERIREHGMRATSIVRAMLMHTRKGGGRRETVSLNEFLDQFVMLSYHGMRMLHPEHDLRLHTEYDRSIVGVQLLPQEMSRVIVNICNNAWEAAIERADRDVPLPPGDMEDTVPAAGPVENGARRPEVHVRSEAQGDRVRIVIRDNGDGIPEEMHGKIFEPFYTTKRSGNNAGLGLSMSYEIVTQLHQGTLGVRSEQGVFSEFIIDIPRNDVTRPD